MAYNDKNGNSSNSNGNSDGSSYYDGSYYEKFDLDPAPPTPADPGRDDTDAMDMEFEVFDELDEDIDDDLGGGWL